MMGADRSRGRREGGGDDGRPDVLAEPLLDCAAAAALNALFTAVGLQFGLWAAPVFAPLLGWLIACMVCKRVLRPVELDSLGWLQRFFGAEAPAVVLWVVWPLWAGPVARAWKTAHGGRGGIASDGPRYPLHAVLGASPVMMGLVAFLLLALVMVLAPNVRARDREPPGPPGGPKPLRAPLVSERRPPLPPRRP